MIRDLTLSLRALLTKSAGDFPELSAALVAFDRPTDSFNPTQPTLSLFLYDIRENTELRSNDPDISMVGGKAVIRKAPMRVVCTYLVTAWPGNTTGDERFLAEQTLLSQALMVFSRYPRVPAVYLTGALVGQDPDLPLITAQAEGLRNPSEFWTALNNKLRPSLSVAVTISMQPNLAITAPLVITSETRISAQGTLKTDMFAVGGMVMANSGAPPVLGPVAGAAVTIVSLGLTTQSDPVGRYVLPAIPAGTYVVTAAQGTMVKSSTLNIPAAAGITYDLTLN